MLFRRAVVGLSAVICVAMSGAQTPAPAADAKPPVPLADVVRDLPDYQGSDKILLYTEAFDHATPAEREAAVPGLIAWLKDDRPRVRMQALASLYILFLPSETHPEAYCSRYLPEQDVPVVAEHLRDPDVQVRSKTVLALQTVVQCGHGRSELVNIVLPMLKDADALTQVPDPSFLESDKFIREHMSPEQRAAFDAMPRKVILLPALGPELLTLLPMREATPAAEDAVVAFLDRKDQTKATLTDCLHTMALSGVSPRLADEALRRVFEEKAMSVFLLQFVPSLRLTPEQFATQRQRLMALSKDETARPSLRRAAATVAACWTAAPTQTACRPSSEDFQDDANGR